MNADSTLAIRPTVIRDFRAFGKINITGKNLLKEKGKKVQKWLGEVIHATRLKAGFYASAASMVGHLPIPLIFQVKRHPRQSKQYWDFRQWSYSRSEGLFRINAINSYSDRDGKFLKTRTFLRPDQEKGDF